MIGRGLRLPRVDTIASHQLRQGCGACAYACPSKAIELRNVIDVGIRPFVDPTRCADCRDCVKVCSGIELTHDRSQWPAQVMGELTREWGPVLELWEGHAGDEEIWSKGSSGGAATALALYCIERGGMHGTLHVGIAPKRPRLNQIVISRSGARSARMAQASSRISLVGILGIGQSGKGSAEAR